MYTKSKVHRVSYKFYLLLHTMLCRAFDFVGSLDTDGSQICSENNPLGERENPGPGTFPSENMRV